MAIGVVVLQPFLGVSSLNLGLLATAALFLRCCGLAQLRYHLQVLRSESLRAYHLWIVSIAAMLSNRGRFAFGHLVLSGFETSSVSAALPCQVG